VGINYCVTLKQSHHSLNPRLPSQLHTSHDRPEAYRIELCLKKGRRTHYPVLLFPEALCLSIQYDYLFARGTGTASTGSAGWPHLQDSLTANRIQLLGDQSERHPRNSLPRRNDSISVTKTTPASVHTVTADVKSARLIPSLAVEVRGLINNRGSNTGPLRPGN
jgi:hypothetical protein